LDHLAARILPQFGIGSHDLEEEAEGGNWVVLAGRGGHHLGDERRQGVGGVAVKGMPRSVIAAGRARVGVASGILDVAQRRLLAVKPKRLGITRHRGATNMGGGGVGSAPSSTA